MWALRILNGQEMIFMRPTSGTLPKERMLIGQTLDVLLQVKAHIISWCGSYSVVKPTTAAAMPPMSIQMD